MEKRGRGDWENRSREAGRGGNFFPEDGFFFVEDDFSAAESFA